jgi:hypothetical protein
MSTQIQNLSCLELLSHEKACLELDVEWLVELGIDGVGGEAWQRVVERVGREVAEGVRGSRYFLIFGEVMGFLAGHYQC